MVRLNVRANAVTAIASGYTREPRSTSSSEGFKLSGIYRGMLCFQFLRRCVASVRFSFEALSVLFEKRMLSFLYLRFIYCAVTRQTRLEGRHVTGAARTLSAFPFLA